MNLEELFLKRQSTREFSEEEITDEQITEICRLASLAPSALNLQPYKLYGINGKAVKKFTKYVQVNGANSWADSTAAYIVIQSLEQHTIKRGERTVSNAEFIGNDVGILSAYIALAAENMNIQTCIIGLRDERGIAEFLNLPEDTKFPLIIALGHKSESCVLRDKKRRDLENTLKIIR